MLQNIIKSVTSSHSNSSSENSISQNSTPCGGCGETKDRDSCLPLDCCENVWCFQCLVNNMLDQQSEMHVGGGGGGGQEGDSVRFICPEIACFQNLDPGVVKLSLAYVARDYIRTLPSTPIRLTVELKGSAANFTGGQVPQSPLEIVADSTWSLKHLMLAIGTCLDLSKMNQRKIQVLHRIDVDSDTTTPGLSADNSKQKMERKFTNIEFAYENRYQSLESLNLEENDRIIVNFDAEDNRCFSCGFRLTLDNTKVIPMCRHRICQYCFQAYQAKMESVAAGCVGSGGGLLSPSTSSSDVNINANTNNNNNNTNITFYCPLPKCYNFQTLPASSSTGTGGAETAQQQHHRKQQTQQSSTTHPSRQLIPTTIQVDYMKSIRIEIFLPRDSSTDNNGSQPPPKSSASSHVPPKKTNLDEKIVVEGQTRDQILQKLDLKDQADQYDVVRNARSSNHNNNEHHHPPQYFVIPKSLANKLDISGK